MGIKNEKRRQLPRNCFERKVQKPDSLVSQRKLRGPGVGEALVVALHLEVLGGDQLVLVPLAVHVVEHEAGVLGAPGLDVDHSLPALLVHGDVKDLGLDAPVDDVAFDVAHPVGLEVLVVEHVADLQTGGGRLHGTGRLPAVVESRTLPAGR